MREEEGEEEGFVYLRCMSASPAKTIREKNTAAMAVGFNCLMTMTSTVDSNSSSENRK